MPTAPVTAMTVTRPTGTASRHLGNRPAKGKARKTNNARTTAPAPAPAHCATATSPGPWAAWEAAATSGPPVTSGRSLRAWTTLESTYGRVHAVAAQAHGTRVR